MDNDIDTAEALARGVCDDCTSFFGGQVRFDEQLLRHVFRTGPRCRKHLRAEFPKQSGGRGTSSFGSGRNEGALASQGEKICHYLISSLTILSSLMVNVWVSTTGLPGNLPLTLARTNAVS